MAHSRPHPKPGQFMTDAEGTRIRIIDWADREGMSLSFSPEDLVYVKDSKGVGHCLSDQVIRKEVNGGKAW